MPVQWIKGEWRIKPNASKPVLTLLSFLAMAIFGFGSIPLIEASLDRQLASANFNSEDARESAGLDAAVGFVAGVFLASTLGAAVGLGMAVWAIKRKERWRHLAIFSAVINSVALLLGLLVVMSFLL